MSEPRIMQHVREMAPAKKIYTQEIQKFAKNYKEIGKMTIIEQPDIDTMDFIYSFERVNGASEEKIEQIHDELYKHMRNFCKENNIWEFYLNTIIDMWR